MQPRHPSSTKTKRKRKKKTMGTKMRKTEQVLRKHPQKQDANQS